jgi:hypothetical protein
LAAKITERNRILTLFRKGRINEADLDRQMDQIDREEAGLRSNIEDVSARLLGVDGVGRVQSAEALLEELRGRLDAGVSWEVKRNLIEALVGIIRIDTSDENGKRCASIAITYRFGVRVSTCTDSRSVVLHQHAGILATKRETSPPLVQRLGLRVAPLTLVPHCVRRSRGIRNTPGCPARSDRAWYVQQRSWFTD